MESAWDKGSYHHIWKFKPHLKKSVILRAYLLQENKSMYLGVKSIESNRT